jgi:ribonuclease HI
MSEKVELYTDGANSRNLGRGGWAAIVVAGSHKREMFDWERDTTQNRMELRAAIEGLRALPGPCQVTVYSDSTYLIDAFAKEWIESWQLRGWRTLGGSPVLNSGLWQELLVEVDRHEVEWQWVRGHDGNLYNERCDLLAVEAYTEMISSGERASRRTDSAAR